MSDPSKPAILIQLDPDQHPSVFDSVVAIDSGVDRLLPMGNVEPLDVRDLVHGAIFTRGVQHLNRTAIFIGGTSVQAGERLLRAVEESFFGDMRVSVMLDANGANTTAAAAVLCLARHMEFAGQRIAVLGGTGSVGRRVAWLAATRGAVVSVMSRSLDRASGVCRELLKRNADLDLTPVETGNSFVATMNSLPQAQGLVAAGAAGVELLPAGQLDQLNQLACAIDLNAVPPGGLADVEATDQGRQTGSRVQYGAIGVGGLKMKIHKRCLQALFESRDRILDVDEIHEAGRQIVEQAD